MLRFILILFTACFALPLFAQESNNPVVDNSVQAGAELDSNVFKAFGEQDKDSVFRLLLKSRGSALFQENVSGGWNIQLGGKKYYTHDEQDVLISYIEIPFAWNISDRVALSIVPDFKLQDENDAVDLIGKDINEDYLSTTTRAAVLIRLPSAFTLEPYGTYTFFRFSSQSFYSFHLERGGLTLRKALFGVTSVGAQYNYGRQQFFTGGREDTENEVSAFFQYVGLPYFSTRYTYENANSSISQFAYTNHRVTVLVSFPFGKTHDTPAEPVTEENPGSLFAIHLLGTLQFKDFPSVFGETIEGQRYLLTGAEDENFNSFVAKFSVHPKPWVAVETKYTRYSNELSSQTQDFSRSLYYAGVRIAF